MKKYPIYLLLLFSAYSNSSYCRDNKGAATSHQKLHSTLAGCIATTAQVDLGINNVRAHILNGGDLWWDYTNNATGLYEVPVGSGKMSIYAGAIWVGGYDLAANLKMAAQTYRQTGSNDFWSGPISKDALGALDVTPATCTTYDRFWKFDRAQVVTFASGGERG